MLLTLATGSFINKISDPGSEGGMSMFTLPKFAMSQLALRGMNVPASMLAGWSMKDMDTLRDAADKAACPCLVLVEDTPLKFADKSPEVRAAAAERVQRLAAAAHRLGCNSLSISFEAPDKDDAFELVATEVKSVMPAVERLELNVLLAPCAGLTFKPDRLTDLIKRIGGFRIGSLPSFGHAAKTGDHIQTLRKLAPYAGAVHATVRGFGKDGKHKDYDLTECVTAIRSVGFVNTLAIDFQGKGDPVKAIEQASVILQAAIDADL